MGLFDEIAGGLAKQFSGGGSQNNILESVMGLLKNPQIGGISGLVQMFNGKGLGDIIGSWVSTGNNLPVTAEQLKQALGSDHIERIASDSGISPEEASSGLASILPGLIDKLTPDGKVPDSEMLSQGLEMLKGRFFNS